MKRYVKEFADDELNRLNEFSTTRKSEIADKINNAVKFCEEGYISEFEAVRAITEAYTFND